MATEPPGASLSPTLSIPVCVPYLAEPPNAMVKDAVARGLIPREWAENYNRNFAERCTCSHARGIHPDDGPCQAKGCRKALAPCRGFRLDSVWQIPGWKTKGLADVGPVVPAKKAP